MSEQNISKSKWRKIDGKTHSVPKTGNFTQISNEALQKASAELTLNELQVFLYCCYANKPYWEIHPADLDKWGISSSGQDRGWAGLIRKGYLVKKPGYEKENYYDFYEMGTK